MKFSFILSIVIPMVLAKTLANDVDLILLNQSIQSIDPTAKIKAVKPSAIPGLYEVQINNKIIYLSANGEKVISGDMYDLKNKVNLTEKSAKTLYKKALAAIPDKDKIIYKAKDEKYSIDVFTDITCGYCIKLHQSINDFNELGVTVKYVAFPRAGIDSKPAKDMQKIWCAKNKTIALDEAKENHKTPEQSCSGNQVAEQFLVGRDIGVYATPTIIFDDGEMLPGYITLKELLKITRKINKQP